MGKTRRPGTPPKTKAGKVVQDGGGLWFISVALTLVLVRVPLAGIDVHCFNEVTPTPAPHSGVMFSDGVESDFLEFNSGAIAHFGVSWQAGEAGVGKNGCVVRRANTRRVCLAPFS